MGPRSPQLDGLHGLAILMVVTYRAHPSDFSALLRLALLLFRHRHGMGSLRGAESSLAAGRPT